MARYWLDVQAAVEGLPPYDPSRPDPRVDWLQGVVDARLGATLYFRPGIVTIHVRTNVRSDGSVVLRDPPLILPPTIHLVFEPGAVLQLRTETPSDLVLLTIEGPVDAGLHPIFDVFDPTPLQFGAPAKVYGQIRGPFGNEELYPQWWGAQTDPLNLAWSVPSTSEPPLGMSGGSEGHTESVDSLATQLCLNASRDGQTVRMVGDFALSFLNLANPVPTDGSPTTPDVVERRKVGDNLRIEGFGGTLSALALPAFPARPVPLAPTYLPGTNLLLSLEHQLILLANRLYASYRGHIRSEYRVKQKELNDRGEIVDVTNWIKCHFYGDINISGNSDSWGVFLAGSGVQLDAKYAATKAEATELIDEVVRGFNDHLNFVSVTVPSHHMASTLPPMRPYVGDGLVPSRLDHLYEVLAVFIEHVTNPEGGHQAPVLIGDLSDLKPNTDPTAGLMRRIGRYEAMWTTDGWTGLYNASLTFEALHMVGPLQQVLDFNRSVPEPRQLRFRNLQFEQAHALTLLARKPGAGGSGGGRLAIEVDDCRIEGFLGDGVLVGANTDFMGRNLRIEECVRAAVAQTGGSSTVHLANLTVRNDPALGLVSALDLEPDHNGVQPDKTPTASVLLNATNVALFGGARFDLTTRTGKFRDDLSTLVRLTNVVCERGGLTLEMTGTGDMAVPPFEPVEVCVRNGHFGGDVKLSHPGHVRMSGCTFEPHDVPADALGSLADRAEHPAYFRPMTVMTATLASASDQFVHRVELQGCAFLLSATARGRAPDAWWSAIQFSCPRQPLLSALTLEGTTISEDFDLGVQNPVFRLADTPGSNPFTIEASLGGRLMARHLINLARLPFDLHNDGGARA